jgi:predicted aminopeptidase
MLERDEGDLAGLIIHEMVHATIFVKDSVDFNENLASFIGDRGAEQFLISKYGANSDQYLSYINKDQDYIKYVNHILRGTKTLDSLYSALVDEPVDIKEQRKSAMIGKIVQSLDTLSLSSSKLPSQRFAEKLPNNAYFMSFIHYQSGQEDLWKEWEQTFDKDLNKYIKFLTTKYPFL